MLRRLPYAPPAWARGLKAPAERYQLGVFPTPVHPWQVPGVPAGVEVFAKRDDLSGMQLSGNKVRKLEFLLAEAHAQGADSVVTIGGIQSNHCRATAVAARYLGLDSHLVLRNSAQGAAADPGLVGNLLVERMVGATIHQVTKAEYAQHGGQALGEAVAEHLRAEGRRPYVIPVGGSNALGSWGYLEAIRELEADVAELGITDIACACGSGGTIAGLALGAHLSGLGVRIHAFGVCDSPDYFYDYIDGLLAGMGSAGPPARELLEAVDVKGAGYALSREEELAFCCEVSARTGIVLDPVYSGKAMFGLVNAMRARPRVWAGRKVLFVHTGGLLGMYDKADQLAPLVAAGSRAERLEV